MAAPHDRCTHSQRTVMRADVKQTARGEGRAFPVFALVPSCDECDHKEHGCDGKPYEVEKECFVHKARSQGVCLTPLYHQCFFWCCSPRASAIQDTTRITRAVI